MWLNVHVRYSMYTSLDTQHIGKPKTFFNRIISRLFLQIELVHAIRKNVLDLYFSVSCNTFPPLKLQYVPVLRYEALHPDH